jgi:hypothetical protein
MRQTYGAQLARDGGDMTRRGRRAHAGHARHRGGAHRAHARRKAQVPATGRTRTREQHIQHRAAHLEVQIPRRHRRVGKRPSTPTAGALDVLDLNLALRRLAQAECAGVDESVVCQSIDSPAGAVLPQTLASVVRSCRGCFEPHSLRKGSTPPGPRVGAALPPPVDACLCGHPGCGEHQVKPATTLTIEPHGDSPLSHHDGAGATPGAGWGGERARARP